MLDPHTSSTKICWRWTWESATCSLRSSSTSRQTGHLGGLYSRSRYLSSSAAVYRHFKTSVFNANWPSFIAGPRLHLRHLQPCLCIKDRTYLPPTNSSVIQRSVLSTAQFNNNITACFRALHWRQLPPLVIDIILLFKLHHRPFSIALLNCLLILQVLVARWMSTSVPVIHVEIMEHARIKWMDLTATACLDSPVFFLPAWLISECLAYTVHYNSLFCSPTHFRCVVSVSGCMWTHYESCTNYCLRPFLPDTICNKKQDLVIRDLLPSRRIRSNTQLPTKTKTC